jgi:hypothetical protein
MVGHGLLPFPGCSELDSIGPSGRAFAVAPGAEGEDIAPPEETLPAGEDQRNWQRP